MTSYREDMRAAWDASTRSRRRGLETRFGTIEYADQGEVLPLLVSHGVLGSHVDDVDGWWAELPGPGSRVIGPSRFGYLGSTFPKDATPADQADAYALLLERQDRPAPGRERDLRRRDRRRRSR
jgi:2-hydroxy-6-oxonona-2,4-dienedioate hydrolase